MKFNHVILLAALLMATAESYSQDELPQKDIDYLFSFQEDSREADNVTYTYYLENQSASPMAFYNFSVRPDNYRYEILSGLPEDVLVVPPYEKNAFIQVKVYDNGPNVTWYAKFLRDNSEPGIYPEQEMDYVYYWKSVQKSETITTYSYHLKNISSRNIEFYGYSLNNNGGIYYLVDKMVEENKVLAPGESFQLIKYNLKSGEAPTVDWYADWSYSVPVGDPFCDGLWRVIDASVDEGFWDIRGDMRKEANDADVFFDQYDVTSHIDGMTDEYLEDIFFFWQYTGVIGYPGTLDEVNNRYFLYKEKLESCAPHFPIKPGVEEGAGLLKAEYEGTKDSYYHYLRLEVVEDFNAKGYKLLLTVEQVYDSY